MTTSSHQWNCYTGDAASRQHSHLHSRVWGRLRWVWIRFYPCPCSCRTSRPRIPRGRRIKDPKWDPKRDPCRPEFGTAPRIVIDGGTARGSGGSGSDSGDLGFPFWRIERERERFRFRNEQRVFFRFCFYLLLRSR